MAGCTKSVHNYTRGMCDCKQAEALAAARADERRLVWLEAAEIVDRVNHRLGERCSLQAISDSFRARANGEE
jgi:hypothetical protein